jgi:hypothetical protein
MALTYSNIVLIKYFEDAFLTIRKIVSLNFVTLDMWGSFLIKEDNYKNLTIWILLAHHVQGHTYILQNL